MAQDPAVLVYYKDIIVSCAGWDEDELGWYLRLLCHQADKPEGLPNDLETLASLANVKHSKYERFCLCWKRTLEAKFNENAAGKLENGKMKKVTSDRKEYSEKQQLRGIVGAFMKVARQEYSFSKEQDKELSALLFNNISISMSKADRSVCFKRTLEAFIAIAIANGNINKEEGTGEDVEPPLYAPEGFKHGMLDIDLLVQKVVRDDAFKLGYVQVGFPIEKLEDWLKAFCRFLRFQGTTHEPEKVFRFGFIGWLKKRKPTDEPKDYSPTKNTNERSFVNSGSYPKSKVAGNIAGDGGY